MVDRPCSVVLTSGLHANQVDFCCWHGQHERAPFFCQVVAWNVLGTHACCGRFLTLQLWCCRLAKMARSVPCASSTLTALWRFQTNPCSACLGTARYAGYAAHVWVGQGTLAMQKCLRITQSASSIARCGLRMMVKRIPPEVLLLLTSRPGCQITFKVLVDVLDDRSAQKVSRPYLHKTSCSNFLSCSYCCSCCVVYSAISVLVTAEVKAWIHANPVYFMSCFTLCLCPDGAEGQVCCNSLAAALRRAATTACQSFCHFR